MKLSNSTYDVLKWVIAIVLPAFILLVATVGDVVAWQSTDTVVQIMTAVNTFLGSIFMISSHNYNNEI